MAGIFLDASIYIACLRDGESSILRLRSFGSAQPLWLSAVVLEELYAGTGRKGRKELRRFQRDFTAIRRVLVPSLSDWTRTGEVLSFLGEKYGYESIGRGRLTNDALIATGAARNGMTLITLNERDFGKIEEFCPFQWQLWNAQSTHF